MLVATLLVVSLVAVRPVGTAAPRPAGPPSLAAASLDAEKKQADALVSKFDLVNKMGPLAPVALSPFFALTFLSGASLLADTGVPFLQGIKGNPILGTGSALNNGFVFAGLLALTLLTAIPKLTKVTKPLAQAVDQIEGHAGIISIVLVQYLSTIHLGDAPPPAATMVFQAGIFSFTGDLLIAIASAINIFVINTVKFFFEVLVWLSPIPVVDAVFEAANKAIAAFLLAVYVWSPWVAMVLNLIIFGCCLMIFAWVYRRVTYMRGMLGDPLLGWCAEKIFRRPPVTLASTPLPSSSARQLNSRTLVLKAFAAKALEDVPRKSRGFLVQTEGRLVFVRPRLLRSPVIKSLPQAGHRVELKRGLLSNTVVFTNDAGEVAMTLMVTRRYNTLLESIRAQLGAPAALPASTAPAKTLATSRELGAAAKHATGRDELRAEFA